MSRKICVVTGSRAEYGLLFWLMKEINADSQCQLQIIVTGMHLSPEFGLTVSEIEKDFRVDKKIEILLSSDTPVGVGKSTGLGLISFSEALAELSPDLLVLLGDRYEILAAAISGTFLKIPIAHIHGGETTEGAFDESIRHSISKMSHLHFTATDTYRKRVIQLGESPDRVFNVGGLGLDSIQNLKLLSRNELEKSAGFQFLEKNLLITFHPVTLENTTASEQFSQLLLALEDLKNTRLIFTKANADTSGRGINAMIDDFVSKCPDRCIAFTSLGQLRYLSAMQFVDAVVGNSSSGLLEAPSFKIGTVNIGDRQTGRIKAESVIDCLSEKADIQKAINRVYEQSFQNFLKNVENPYGSGGASNKIMSVLRTFSLESILKKKFYDIVF